LNAKEFEYHETTDGVDLIISRKVEDKDFEICFKSKQHNEDEDSDDYPLNEESAREDLDDRSYTDFTV
jgi:hypothetical protein